MPPATICYLDSWAPAVADMRVLKRRQVEARRKDSQAAYWAHARGGACHVGKDFQSTFCDFSPYCPGILRGLGLISFKFPPPPASHYLI